MSHQMSIRKKFVKLFHDNFILTDLQGSWTKAAMLLLWQWTKAAMMLDWESSTVDITTTGIVGGSYCRSGVGYCSVLVLAVLTDCRWKLSAHTVTPLDVTTVARCCRQTQYVLHPAECHQQHCKHHSDNGQQVSSLPDIARDDTAICV
jgi:hypothetical protein